jgi:hypothetical protein
LRCAQKLVYQFYPVSASAYQGILLLISDNVIA